MSTFKYILHWILPIVSTIICTAFYFTADYKNLFITFAGSFSLIIILSLLHDFIEKKIKNTEEPELSQLTMENEETPKTVATDFIDTDKASRLEVGDLEEIEDTEEEQPTLSEAPAEVKERTKRGIFSVD